MPANGAPPGIKPLPSIVNDASPMIGALDEMPGVPSDVGEPVPTGADVATVPSPMNSASVISGVRLTLFVTHSR